MLTVDVAKRLRDFTLEAALEVKKGEVLVLIGENGAGKSTVLNLISGLLTPDRGTMTLDGQVLFSDRERINVPPEKRNIGHLFQSYALFPHLTVYENVAFGLRCRKMPEEAVASRVMSRLEEMDMVALSREPAGSLSGGQPNGSPSPGRSSSSPISCCSTNPWLHSMSSPGHLSGKN